MHFANFYLTFSTIHPGHRGRFWIPMELDPAFFEPVPQTARLPVSQKPRNPGDLMTAAEAANFLGLSPKTLANWRVSGAGPRFVKLGGRVGYRVTDLENFVTENIKASTSEGARHHG